MKFRPWKRMMRRSLDAVFPKSDDSSQKKSTEEDEKLWISTFEDRALGRLLTPLEALIGIHLNPMEERMKGESKEVLRHLLFMVPRKEMFTHHNW